MTDDEVDALHEDMAEIRADNERLQMEAADTEARLSELTETLAEARAELARSEEEAETLRGALAEAVAQFRQASLAAEPELPDDLVTGETIEDVTRSLAAARSLVQQVRERLAGESGASGPRVPPGAPARRPPDLDALSSREKIAEGLRSASGGQT